MGTSMTESCDDFEQMWPRPRAARPVRRQRRLLPPALLTPSSPSCAPGSSSSAPRAASSVEADGNGNLLAWWKPCRAAEATDAVLIGSHLDSVLDGGAYDGPLGVVSALAAIDLLRERGTVPRRPIGVGAFAEEEGSRFGLACLGSRLATGATDPEAAARAARPGRRTPAGRDGCRRPRPGAGPGCLARPDRLLRGAARRAGPRPGRPRRAGRPGHRDLAARALPLRLHRRRRTTPAPRGWRTGTTRCSASR